MIILVAKSEQKENEREILEKQFSTLETDFKKLKRKYALEDIDPEIYKELSAEFVVKIDAIKRKIENVSQKISNLDNYIDISTEIAQNPKTPKPRV